MRVVSLLIFLSLFSFSHPLNLTKMSLELNSSKPSLFMRFVAFNLEKPLSLKDPDTESILRREKEIIFYVKKHFHIKECVLKEPKLFVKNEIVIDLFFTPECTDSLKKLSIKFDLFFDFDKTQQGVMKIAYRDFKKEIVFSPGREIYEVSFSKKDSFFETFLSFVREGVWHIWIGADHLLFLLMLILPSVIFHKNFKKIFLEVLKIVTAFTISHSVTLFLSMFHIVTPSQKLIESLIAFSVFLTALNNVYFFISYRKEWFVAFLFGFIHGFGFANALSELSLDKSGFLTVVSGFNLGVEIGQIIVISAVLPMLFYLSKGNFYKKYIYLPLTFLTLIISFLWFVDRSFELRFMPF